MRRIEEARKLDLRISGRVLLYAAILVRMKAEAILSSLFEEEEEEFVADSVGDFDLEVEEEEIEVPELRIVRRRVRKVTTLRDLIEELRRAEEIEVRRRKRRVTRVIDEPLRYPHRENMEETILRVERELMELLRTREMVTLSELAGKDVSKLVDYYVSVLHLVFRRKVDIRQEKMYESDIEIFLPDTAS